MNEDLVEGVWVVFFWDMGPHVSSIHPLEIDALREINNGEGSRVAHVPYGADLQKLLRERFVGE